MPTSQVDLSQFKRDCFVSVLPMGVLWLVTLGVFASAEEGALHQWMLTCVCTLTVAVGMHIICPVVQVLGSRRLRALAGCSEVLCALALLVLALLGLIALFSTTEIPSSSHLAALCLVVLYLLYDLWRLVECTCTVCVLLAILPTNIPESSQMSARSDSSETGKLSMHIKDFDSGSSENEPKTAATPSQSLPAPSSFKQRHIPNGATAENYSPHPFLIEDISYPKIIPMLEEVS